MNKDNLKFPYPVLGHSDDVDNTWGCTYTTICDEEYITFKVDVTNSFSSLVDLIDDHKAVYACEVQCSYTFMRKVFTSDQPTFEINIARNEIRNFVELTMYVIVTESTPMYQSSAFKKVVQDNIKFFPRLEVGEILAILPTYTLPVDIDYSTINKQPIVELRKSNDDFVRTEYERDIIQVMLPDKLFMQLNNMKDNSSYLSIFHSSFITNALLEAIPHMRDEACKNKQWSKKIHLLIDSDPKFDNLDPKYDTSKLVQLLLENPYMRMINDLTTLND